MANMITSIICLLLMVRDYAPSPRRFDLRQYLDIAPANVPTNCHSLRRNSSGVHVLSYKNPIYANVSHAVLNVSRRCLAAPTKLFPSNLIAIELVSSSLRVFAVMGRGQRFATVLKE
jgi:hypothetical protein